MKRALVILAALAVAGCSSVHSQAKMAEDNKALVQRFIDRMNKHDLNAVDELVDAAYVEHSPGEGFPPTRDGLKQMFAMFIKGFPDVNMRLDHMVAEGDLVVIHILTTGTNKGEMMGMPATGKSIKVEEIHIVKTKDGKMVEHWGVEDNLTFMKQLGLMPSPEKK